MNKIHLFCKSAITQSWRNSCVLSQQFHQIVCRMKSLNIPKKKVSGSHKKKIDC